MKKSSVCLILLALLFPSCQQNQEIPVEPGVSLQLAEHRKSVLSDIRYRLHFDIPSDRADVIGGSLELSFVLSDNRQPLQIDFRADPARLKSVRINEQPSGFRFEHEHIVIPANELAAGPNIIAIEFTAGEAALNRNPDFLYTLFVPDRARTAFPLFDQPGLKAVYELSLTIPSGWQAMANGPLLRQETTGLGRTLYFGPSDLIPSYLFAFVAGEFQTVTRTLKGREITLIHRETDTAKVDRNLDEIFRLHVASLDWLEAYTGIDHPYQKFDIALIPGFQYGGMEHVGAILYRSDSLFLDEDPSQNTLLARASLIAHETAHMWFGNLVTMEWFNDVWTKEVYANFMAAKMVNPEFPDVDHDLNFLIRHYPAAYSVDRTAGANPIRQYLANLNMAGQMYGPIIYQKAPIMMRQLELLLGEALFQKGIQEYLARFSHANATWPALIDIFDRLTPDRDIADWSEVWVHTEGRPHFTIVSRNPLVIRQEDPLGRGRIWPQRFEITIFAEAAEANGESTGTRTPGNSVLSEIDTADSQSISQNLPDNSVICTFMMDALADEMRVVLPEGCPRDAHILLNSDGRGYGLFEVDFALINRWSDLSDLHRGVLLIDLYENMLEKQGVTPEELALALMNIVATEKNQLLLGNALGRLATIRASFLTESVRDRLQSGLEQILWSGVSNPTHSGSLKRMFFGSYREMAASDESLARLYRIWDGSLSVSGLTLSENDFMTLASELAVKTPEQSEYIVNTQLRRISNPDRKREFEFIMPALSADQGVRDVFFESLMDAENRSTESWVRTALAWLHHPLRVADSERYLQASLEILEEIQVTGDIFFPTQWLNLTFANHTSDTAVQTVRQFLAERPDYNDQLRMRVLQSADNLFRANALLNAD
jgi:aminopeptidase N